MMQQKIKSQAKNTDANQASNSWTRWWPFFAAALLIIVLPIMLAVMKHKRLSKQAPDRLKAGVDQSTQMTLIPPLAEQALKDTAWDTAWPPLPNVGTPSQPIEQVHALYAFAARHPEVAGTKARGIVLSKAAMRMANRNGTKWALYETSASTSRVTR
jgi:hypothetical protein